MSNHINHFVQMTSFAPDLKQAGSVSISIYGNKVISIQNSALVHAEAVLCQ